MLVISRKLNEAIVIGDGLEVRVMRVGRDGVRLGVTAPSSVSVHRAEVYDQIREENRVAPAAENSADSLAERLRRSSGRLVAEGESAPVAVPASQQSSE